MGNKKLRTREEIAPEHKWNLEAMYTSEEEWNRDIDAALSGAGGYDRFRGHLGDSPATLADALEESDRIGQTLEKAFVYARMKLDEDNRDSRQQAMLDKAMQTISRVSAALSFVTPEIISIPEDRILQFMDEEPRLKVYGHLLRSTLREKEHVLSTEEENLMAQLGEVLGSSNSLFTMLNDADLKFGSIHDENGEETELTHGNYINFMRSYNRDVRKEAYTACYETYRSLINTLASNYSANVKTDAIVSRIRRYSSSRASALSGGNIPEAVYDNLVETVNEALPALHDYIRIRRDLLGVDELKMYDVYVPLIQLPEKNIPFEEAVRIAMEGLAPLGEDYLRQFQKGIDDRWIDRYENQGKTSGAYSFGSYDSAPYVLMNYDNRLEDVFTLVHEMGHSMNSFYTRQTQPYVYGDHSIFTAEVASTVNESLLMRHLLNTAEDPQMRAYVLNMYIEAFRTTLFRQTMFAEFEHSAHRYVEDGGSLTPEWLNRTYDELNTRYFGPALEHDDLIQYEWARIPHFYRSYYVYQYATGYSAATAISAMLLEQGKPARDAYLRFLACGTNDDPVELLKIAGVDMESKEPVAMAMDTFRTLVDDLKGLTEQR